MSYEGKYKEENGKKRWGAKRDCTKTYLHLWRDEANLDEHSFAKWCVLFPSGFNLECKPSGSIQESYVSGQTSK